MTGHEKKSVILRAIDEIDDNTTIFQIQRIIEKALIEYALYRAGHNMTWAARKLGIGRTTLVMKIRSFINPPKRYRKQEDACV